ncbi:MAG: PEGA domain-containing protein [Polyangiaceae bacterium]|nr:PEGA domain-containing protein [Polyangiaceae bacterium]
MRFRHAVVVCVVLAAWPASVAHAADVRTPKETTEAAKRLFDEGLDLEKRGSFASAFDKFKEAEAMTATAGLRFHKAYCLEMIGKLVPALEEYEAADRLAEETNKPEVRSAIAARIDPLRTRVPKLVLRVTSPPSGVDVMLDQKTVVADELDGKPFRVEPGEHTIEARAPGYESFARTVTASDGSSTTVEIALSPVGVAPVPRPSPRLPQEPPRHRSYTLPIATTAGAVVLAAGGVVSFILAGNAQSSSRTTCSTQVASCDAVTPGTTPVGILRTTCSTQVAPCDSQRSKIRTLDAVALGGFIGAAGLGVVSVLLWSSGSQSSTTTGQVSPPAAHARLVASPTALGVQGAF